MALPAPRNPARCLSLAACGLVMACATLLVACDSDDIRAYTAPQDAPRPVATMPPGMDPGGAPATAADLHWAVPADWRESPAKQSFTVASYEAGPNDAPVIVTVTRLSGEGGGALENINRWRGQIGLPHVAELPEQPMERIDAGPPGTLVAGLVDLVGEAGPTGQPARIVGALLPRAEQNETWFFKMTGPRDILEPLKPQLIDMIGSIHPAGPGHHHGPTPTTDEAAVLEATP